MTKKEFEGLERGEHRIRINFEPAIVHVRKVDNNTRFAYTLYTDEGRALCIAEPTTKGLSCWLGKSGLKLTGFVKWRELSMYQTEND